ncbi:NAD(P)/FAD-dependent oxidoreductase [Chengkuizengella axinellae]|uniref:NAD(P)/FAD-dependent oxidoreductase n=1 Tax=Chengkuizengella axinellae TaxID=3064388 RepID=A0ABT9J1L7_9BACL|nr:NAD(P)/FAD-dependent oxidoreductase [Chengkuizengella sp. 2205SS18-9]MDP5275511.1 NAD(P)/FAD-dependent oxidoreductase [Chengkuizengella sp. 2205SS18-9]
MNSLLYLYDVVIVGGGPAGLSAALVLGRSKRRVLLFDDNKPRHAVTYESHGYLTRDGIKPNELKKISRTQLEKYSNVTIKNEKVVYVNSIENGTADQCFNIVTEQCNTFYSRKILFATGVKDQLPQIKGLNDIYGRSAFPCPYCDAWEFSDQPLAVIGNSKTIFEYTRSLHNWSTDLVLFTNGTANMTEKQKRELIQHKIPIIESKIKCLESQKGMLKSFQLEDGKKIIRKAAFVEEIREVQSCKIPKELGCKIDANGAYLTEQNGLSDVPGVYIIGDAKNLFSGLMKSASEGYCAAVSINKEIIEENW